MTMSDQANKLRRQMKQSEETPREAKTISFVSGKGGVGKSNIAINFSLELSKLHYKVLMIDLDVGMGNIDILLGVQPRYTIVDMLEENRSMESIVEKGPGNLSFIAGGSSLSNLFALSDHHMHYFLSEFGILVQKYDYIIFDMGAGITKDSLFFILSSDEAILVTTPEPTSITDGYSLIKHLHKDAPTMPVHVVMNRSLSHKNGTKALQQFERVVRRFLQRSITKLAIIPDDKVVREAVMNQRPFTLYRKNSSVSKSVQSMVQLYVTGQEVSSTKHPLSFIHKMKHFWRERSY